MSAMGLRWYVPLPGPFYVRGGWISALVMMIFWLSYVTLVLVVKAVMMIIVGVVLAVDAGTTRWKRWRENRTR